MLEFSINKYINLKLIEGRTIIYFEEKPFSICKGLVLNINKEILYKTQEFESIDEKIEYLEKIEDDNNNYINDYKISSKEEFFVHCSNLQAWSESNYNSALLDHKLSFPLLRELVNKGDNKAKTVFKEEIAKRFQSSFLKVPFYLITEGFLDYFNKEELDVILLKNNSRLRKSVKKTLKTFIYDSEFEIAIEILRWLSFYFHDKIAFQIYKNYLIKLMYFKPDEVFYFLENYFTNQFNSLDICKFIRRSPKFLDFLIKNPDYKDIFKKLIHMLNEEKLKQLFLDILFITNYNEPMHQITKYLTETFKEYEIILKMD